MSEISWDRRHHYMTDHRRRLWSDLPPDEIEEPALPPPPDSLAAAEARTWLCVTHCGGTFTVAALETCTPQFFFDWTRQVYPPARLMDHQPSDYATAEARGNAFWNILNLVRSLAGPRVGAGRA
jgi:hypothetical protein